MSTSPYYRKIIQIAVSPGDEEDTIYALASDGTVWRVVLATDGGGRARVLFAARR